jgi:hypothetical protein
MNHDLMADALRASACGLHASEAAVALVIDHRYWLTRADFLTGSDLRQSGVVTTQSL